MRIMHEHLGLYCYLICQFGTGGLYSEYLNKNNSATYFDNLIANCTKDIIEKTVSNFHIPYQNEPVKYCKDK